jgi:ribosomal protein L9
MNGIGYGTDSDSDSSITKGGVSGYNDPQGIFTTDNREALAGKLENNFDAGRVNEELGAQTQITQAFDQERRKIKTEINAKEQKLRKEAEEQGQLGNSVARDTLLQQADKVQNQGLLFDAISGAIYGPNSNGVTGYVAKVVSPFVSNQIGQYYKEQSETQGYGLTGSQQAGHILAHGILGAAVSYATGNDALTGGVSAGAGEATAPVLSKFLYGSSDPTNLTAEQKDTISAITSVVGLTIGATTGSANDAANAAETSKVAVDNNHSADLRVDKQLGRVGKSPFSDKEARVIAASIGIAVWPVGVLDAYLKADSDADKILIIREAFGGIKARAISEALQEARGVKSSKNDADGMEPDNDLYSNKPSGKRELAKGLVGKKFEAWLHSSYGGIESFSKGGREFDGAFGNRWYEAKSGNYWRDVTSKPRKLEKFRSDMGDRKRIANENGGTYELHSNTPIPKDIKNWLNKKGISTYEHQ